MFSRLVLLIIVIFGSLLVNTVFAREGHIMTPRVPADQLEDAQALTSPLPDSPEVVEKGKAIYEGKGTCFNCHGKTGRGDGPGGYRSILLLGILGVMGCGDIGRKVKSFGSSNTDHLGQA